MPSLEEIEAQIRARYFGVEQPKKASRKDIFSPTTFDEYVGQEQAKVLAKIMVEAAQKEHRALPNIMIVGEYGLGKTTLANIILHTFQGSVKMVDGASVNKNIPSGHVIIDEIHNIQPEVADTLNLHLDSGNLHIIGCTTNSGALSSAFRSRFRTLFLENYRPNELTSILYNVCERKGVAANKEILRKIALRSRFNARQAITYLSFIFDFMVVSNRSMTDSLVMDAFDKLGVDNKGYNDRDYKFMAALRLGEPVGLQYLSATTGIDAKTIEEEVEPFLLRMGVLDRTQRGRIKLSDIG